MDGAPSFLSRFYRIYSIFKPDSKLISQTRILSTTLITGKGRQHSMLPLCPFSIHQTPPQHSLSKNRSRHAAAPAFHSTFPQADVQRMAHLCRRAVFLSRD
ncbi:hypothetical protein [Faecalibacterium sp. An77]|uniref:hypothetical protein n=1 Tax=Faecalibacterium sp. An77 TaxID=1965655 RepID=UPI0011855E21|nr:hypothetical protein [Faecalibacterium sp. An77]